MNLKLLFDQNLSHRLPVRLADIFPDSAHVRLLGMDRAPDTAIWDFARVHGYVIVTQDSDFVERSKLLGSPPKAVWLRCGNTTPRVIESLVRSHSAAINDLSEPRSASYLQVF